MMSVGGWRSAPARRCGTGDEKGRQCPVAPVAKRPYSPRSAVGVFGDAVTSITQVPASPIRNREVDHRVAAIGGVAGGDSDQIAVGVVKQEFGEKAVDELVGSAGRSRGGEVQVVAGVRVDRIKSAPFGVWR